MGEDGDGTGRGREGTRRDGTGTRQDGTGTRRDGDGDGTGIFEIRESIVNISTELPCLDNLENPGRPPVQDVLGGTGECVL